MNFANRIEERFTDADALADLIAEREREEKEIRQSRLEYYRSLAEQKLPLVWKD